MGRCEDGRPWGAAAQITMEAFLSDQVEVKAFLLADDGFIPNNKTLPLLVYPKALTAADGDLAGLCERTFAANNWPHSWRNGIYSFPHFHSTAHEVLGICRGTATVRLGGEKGVVLDVEPGDVVAIPAGVGHQNLGASGDLLVVGSYPAGEDWDLCRGETDQHEAVRRNIEQVRLPTADPVAGADGPMMAHWK